MKNYIVCFITLVILSAIVLMTFNKSSFINYVAPYGSPSQHKWWERSGWERFGYPAYSYWEGFENKLDKPASLMPEHSPILEFPPDTPSPADLYNNQPYHLLSDNMAPPREKEALSCVNSRSCYATDFNRAISKTGNFRQLTNNYRREYPDSCSSPYQELVLNFYKADSIPFQASSAM